MGSHKGWDRHFVTIEGLTMKTGRSLNLTKGQFGIVDMESVPTSKGNAVITNFAGLSPDRKLELRLGVAPISVTRSQSNKSWATPAFKISEVKGLKVEAPKTKGIQVDKFRIGYDGLNPQSAPIFQNGDNESIEVNLEGDAIGMLGYANAKTVVKVYLEAPNTGDFTNQEIFEKAVETFNNITLIGGVPITNYVEATTVNSESVALTGTDYSFFKLKIKDFGDYSALALVQAQYPNFTVKQENHEAGFSTYVILAPAVTVLAPYSETVTSLLPGCDECPDGFTLTDGLCVTDGDPVETAWVASDTCKVSTETYKITLADTECGSNRLAELQAQYPDNTIVIDTVDSLSSRRTVTLTGTSGTANINIGGTNYLFTFATNLTTTAANFVTTHGANITTATGGVVTANAGVLTYTDLTAGFPAITITNATGDLAGVIVADTVVPENVAGACMTTYSTTVNTNVLCEQCSPETNGVFESTAPAPFDMISWKKVPKVYSEDALMGIEFTAKVQILAGNEQFRDFMPNFASSVRLSISSGGTIINESFSEGRIGRFAVKMMSRAQEAESLGLSFYDWEERSRVHFEGRTRLEGNNYGKWILGQESHLKPLAQYVDYVLSVRTVRMSQSSTGEVVENVNYHILAEVGKHQDVEDVLNALATEAGIATVQAYS